MPVKIMIIRTTVEMKITIDYYRQSGVSMKTRFRVNRDRI